MNFYIIYFNNNYYKSKRVIYGRCSNYYLLNQIIPVQLRIMQIINGVSWTDDFLLFFNLVVFAYVKFVFKPKAIDRKGYFGKNNI